MTRVLWVSPTISAAFGGPTTTTVNGLVAETRAGLESSLISTTSGGDEAKVTPALSRLSADGVDVKLFPRTSLLAKAEAWGFSPRMAIWMIRNLRKFDVIHLQYVWCMSSICGSILGNLHGIPVVITPHESLTDYDLDIASRSRIKRRLKLILQRLYLRTADCLVFMSELEQRDTASGSTKFQLISHAVQEEIAPFTKSEQSRPDESMRIAFLGRNIPKKGIDLIVEVLGRNRERNWSLYIAGPPGPDEYIKEVQELAEHLGVASKVHWLGFLDERQELFRQIDVLTMPSVYEGFGMVAAEAMCYGVPVIVPRRSGVAEIVSQCEAGIVIPDSTVESLDEALRELDDFPDRRDIYGANGVLAANSHLSYEAYSTATTALYESLRAES